MADLVCCFLFASHVDLTLGVSRRKELFSGMYAQIGEKEQVISPPYTRTPLDASRRDGRRESRARTMSWLGGQCGTMLRALVHDTSKDGLMIRRGRTSNLLYFHWSPLLLTEYFSLNG